MGPFRSEHPPSSISRSLLCYFPRHPGACLSPPLPRAPTPALRVPARELGVCPYKHGCGLVALRSASPGLPAHTASCGRAPGPRPRPPRDAPRSGVAAPAAPGRPGRRRRARVLPAGRARCRVPRPPTGSEPQGSPAAGRRGLCRAPRRAGVRPPFRFRALKRAHAPAAPVPPSLLGPLPRRILRRSPEIPPPRKAVTAICKLRARDSQDQGSEPGLPALDMHGASVRGGVDVPTPCGRRKGVPTELCRPPREQRGRRGTVGQRRQ